MTSARAPRSTCWPRAARWSASQTAYSRSRYDYMLNVLRLKQAAGILDRKALEDVNSWLEAAAAGQPAESAAGAVRTSARAAHRLRLRSQARLPHGSSGSRNGHEARHGAAVRRRPPCGRAAPMCGARGRIGRAGRRPPPRAPRASCTMLHRAALDQQLRDVRRIEVVRPGDDGHRRAPRARAGCGRRSAPGCRRRTPRRRPRRTAAARRACRAGTPAVSGAPAPRRWCA